MNQAHAWNLGGDFLAWLRNSVHVTSTLVDRIAVGDLILLHNGCSGRQYHGANDELTENALARNNSEFYLCAHSGVWARHCVYADQIDQR